MKSTKARYATSAARPAATPRRRSYRHSNVRRKFSGCGGSPALKWASSALMRLGGRRCQRISPSDAATAEAPARTEQEGGPGVVEFVTAPGLRQSFGWRRERAWDRTTRPLFVPTVLVPPRSPVMKPRDCSPFFLGSIPGTLQRSPRSRGSRRYATIRGTRWCAPACVKAG